MRLMMNNWAALIMAVTCWIAPADAQTPCPLLRPQSRSRRRPVRPMNPVWWTHSIQGSLARSLSLQMRRSISQATPESPLSRVSKSREPGTVWTSRASQDGQHDRDRNTSLCGDRA